MIERFQQKALRYTHREEDIAEIARAIDLLGKQRISEAIDVLMAYRNRLQDAQKPEVIDYDQRQESYR